MIGVKNYIDDFVNNSTNDAKNLNKLLLSLKEKNAKEIFISLSEKGLKKVVNGLKSNSSELRSLNLKFIIELLNGNDVLQNIFCEKFNFNPIGNVICLNWFPSLLRECVEFNSNIIYDIKNSATSSVNLLMDKNYVKNCKRTKYWMWPINDMYTDDILPDPAKYLIGFYFNLKLVKINNQIKEYSKEDLKEEKLNNSDYTSLCNKLENKECILNTNTEVEGNNKVKKLFIAAGSGSESATKINSNLLVSNKLNSVSKNNSNKTDKQTLTISNDKKMENFNKTDGFNVKYNQNQSITDRIQMSNLNTNTTNNNKYTNNQMTISSIKKTNNLSNSTNSNQLTTSKSNNKTRKNR